MKKEYSFRLSSKKIDSERSKSGAVEKLIAPPVNLPSIKSSTKMTTYSQRDNKSQLATLDPIANKTKLSVNSQAVLAR
jgi:hypothetical protein